MTAEAASAKPIPHVSPDSHAQSSHPAWTPPSIPLTLGAAFQSWLRPSHHHHHHKHSEKSSPSSTPARSSSNSDAEDDPLPPPAVPSHPTLSAPVNLQYAGRFDQLAAQAELYLYSLATPYFKGAQIGNISNPIHDAGTDAFNGMWREGQNPSPNHNSHDTYRADQRATIGTIQHTDGKVASIRWVSVDPESSESAGHGKSWLSSWFGKSQVPKHALNVLEIGKPEVNAQERDEEEKVVLLHGYGAGTGFYFQNIAALAARPNSRLYALDWLGMGRSSRPSFSIPSEYLKDEVTRVEKAESFFVDSLEEWRKKAGIEKMKIVAHSLGAYLSVSYTLKHPDRVSRLVLVSPAGVGAAPEDQTNTDGQSPRKSANEPSTFTPKNAAYIPEHERGNIEADASSMHTVEREVLEPQESTVPETAQQADAPARPIDSTSKAQTEASRPPPAEANNPPRFSPRTRSVFAWLWEQNFSPFGILRTSQFLGPWLMSRYTTRRFGSLPEDELKALHAYCQGVFLAKGSGEYCLAHILRPGAWARVPMLSRIDALCKPNSPAARLPISFIYGEHDWMDATAGYQVVKKLRTLGNDQGRALVLAHCGHHVYLDNPRGFDRLVKRILDGQADKPRGDVREMTE